MSLSSRKEQVTKSKKSKLRWMYKDHGGDYEWYLAYPRAPIGIPIALAFFDAPPWTRLEQSCRLPASFPITANRFQASVNADAHALWLSPNDVQVLAVY
jgi:hypothetical protein